MSLQKWVGHQRTDLTENGGKTGIHFGIKVVVSLDVSLKRWEGQKGFVSLRMILYWNSFLV